tara:strand:+ start:232 stop:681 length:450 start_codon:yes stop_codon:yes gene_type:complete
MKGSEWLIFEKKVRFGDCDSAGVIHFHNLFRWAHECWEESLDEYGISAHEIFPNHKLKQKIFIPIVSSEGKFFAPINLSDILEIKLMPKKLNNHLFQVKTSFFIQKRHVAETIIFHCAIDNFSRQKVDIPEKLLLWIEASNLKDYIQEC